MHATCAVQFPRYPNGLEKTTGDWTGVWGGVEGRGGGLPGEMEKDAGVVELGDNDEGQGDDEVGVEESDDNYNGDGWWVGGWVSDDIMGGWGSI